MLHVKYYASKINNVAARIRKKYEYRKHQRYLPSTNRADDIYLVSFPKSGNTWVRFLLANAIKNYLSLDREINFFNIFEAIPDVQLNKNIRLEGPFGEPSLSRIIKSHSPYNPYYLRGFLLCRDPRDVMPSYYKYLTSYDVYPADKPFSEFIRHPQYGAAAWEQYTISWLKGMNKQGRNFQIFRYEDFITTPEEQVRKLVAVLGLRLPEETIKKAVEMSSFKVMQTLEKETGCNFSLKPQSTPFVRKGQSDRGKLLLEEDKTYIESMTRRSANLIGYEF
ncbi:MAG: sulfotransferase domain-containing protein [Cyanobacteria bacterium J06581_3]